MKRKGISPLIAAVLLIAFTMAVASLFAQWAPNLISGAQEEASNQTDQLLKCSEYSIEISSNNYNATRAIISQSRGPEGIGNTTVTFEYTDSPPLQTYVNLNTAGAAKAATVNNSSTVDLARITAQTQECGDVQAELVPGEA